MLALLQQLLLPDFARHKAVTVLIHAMPKVLAGDVDPYALPVLQLSFVDELPLLHTLTALVQLLQMRL